ncbi:hypothetical protein [Rhizobium johnstonii]|uniref:hypothetical protein n=1 Tax=Rhizobium johnstonii TaxID=3019933 RepID=UPI003F995B71
MTRNQLSFTKDDRIVPDAKWDELMPEDTGWSLSHLNSLAHDLSDGRSQRRLGM